MQPINSADENELQKAINNITNSAGAEQEAVSAVTDKVSTEEKAEGSAEAAATGAQTASTDDAAQVAGATQAADTIQSPELAQAAGAVDLTQPDKPAESTPMIGIHDDTKASYGDPDLGAVKASALADLRPILEQVDLSPESKYKIYREIILETNDKAAIEPAYNAAKNIAVEKDRAEALLFIVEMIDKLGIGAN